MKKFLSIVVAVAMIALSVPAFALLDDNSTNNAGGNASATATGGQGGNGGIGLGGVGFGGSGGSSYVKDSGNSSNDIRNTNTNLNNADADSKSESESNSKSKSSARSNQKQGQAQGQVAVGKVSTDVGGDKITTYVMTAPNTVAGEGQQAASIYSIVGGVNTAESSEFKLAKEKITLLSQMEASGLITKELAQAEALEALTQLKDASQPRRFLGIGPKTRGVHLLNGLGLLATDGCNEVNWDNAFGLKKKK